MTSIGPKPILAEMQELGWKTVGSCASSRPALNCDLLAGWPLNYRDERQPRFGSERNHADFWKDGYCSVVPRMWGGRPPPRSCVPSPMRPIAI